MRLTWVLLPLFLAAGCAAMNVPDGRSVNIPPTKPPLDRYEGLNEKRDPVTRVRLGRDVLTPKPLREDTMPDDIVGPYELRGETLASALQLILDDYDVSIAFETDEGLRKKVTVSNLHGKLRDVVNKVCSLADLYCHFEEGTLTIKNTETFVVDLPPIGGAMAAGAVAATSAASTGTTTAAAPAAAAGAAGGSSAAYTSIATGLAAVIGTTPVIDTSTRVMIYTATQRSNKYARQYFERLRKNTALIVFETHIWEVTLDNSNSTGIDWNAIFSQIGGSKFNLQVTLPGGVPDASNPMSIAANAGQNVDTQTILDFISTSGSVKTISQPQITLLSGSTATFGVQQSENYVRSLTRTPSTTVPPGPDTISTETATVTTGLNMSITSAWDQSTVYGNLGISINDLLRLSEFPTTGGNLQLPQTTARNLQTEIRVRPGDAILIGGLVSEKDNADESGPGFMKPLIPSRRAITKKRSELVFLLRPRVVVFDMGDDSDTPIVVDAPKEVTAAPDITDRVKDVFGHRDVPQTAPVEALPSGISPEALAPRDPGTTLALPTTIISGQGAPVPLSGAVEDKSGETPAVYRGGLNR